MAFEVKYSVLDRLIHRIAFADVSLQFTAADIEKHLFEDTYKAISVVSPIFITSLPRAGTTLILEALNRLPSLATNTYRDMPFTMSPILWSKLSGFFRKRSDLKERAHGDGMQVGFDSPEAFEEVLWRAFWPEKYTQERIELWESGDEKDEATIFINDHIKKIISLRCADNSKNGRYISKNNGNIARLKLIKHMFPNSKILIPIREPLEHAVSLLRQHHNFLKMHHAEPFVRRYMADIGHYEFGELHKPIAFPGLNIRNLNWDPGELNYWVAYWISAYEYVLENHDIIVPASYEQTCLNAQEELSKICEQLDIYTEGMLDSMAALFHSPPPARADPDTVDPMLRKKANELYHELLKP